MYTICSFTVVLICFYYCQSTSSFENHSLFQLGVNKETKTDYNFEIAACDGCDENVSSENASTYTKLYLYTRETGENFTEIVFRNKTSLKNSAFDANKTTKVLIHGWRGSGFTTFEDTLRETYLSAQDVNVLSVDWSKKADQLYYGSAKSSVVPVGTFVAQFVDWLVRETNVSVDSIHVIGHSLGAQIAGVIGENTSVGKIGRITGLDPAGPGFSNSSTSGRLDASDAQFVDVIHTCARWAGYYDPCGDVDFYPNTGEPPQPGCILDLLVCSHIRAYYYFNESITSDMFVSTPCDSWKEYYEGDCYQNQTISMGENVVKSARGNYYLQTASSYPYALGIDPKLTPEEK